MFDGALFYLQAFLFFITVYAVIDFIVKWRYVKKIGQNTKVAPQLPIIGSVHLIIGTDFLNALLKIAQKLKPSFIIWFFHKSFYYTVDPMEVNTILTSPEALHKSFLYQFIKPVLGNSLLIADVERWKKNRKCFVKCFTQKGLDSLVPIFNRNTDLLVEELQREGKMPSTVKACNIFFLKNFLESIFMAGFGQSNVEASEFYDADIYGEIKKCMGIMKYRFLRPWLHPDVIFSKTHTGNELHQSQKLLDDVLTKIIEEKRAVVEAEEQGFREKNEWPRLIDAMVEGYEDDYAIISESKLFLVAATETSGMAFAISLALLGMYPEVQEKVFEEIIDVMGHDGVLEYNHLRSLVYTEMVLLETLRLFPPAPVVSRTNAEELDLGTVRLPPKTNILVGIMSMHRSEEYWQKPLEFNPERFRSENDAKERILKFLPFSFGPRNCIGAKYSMMSMKSAMAKIVRNFRISSELKKIEDIKVHSYLITLSMPKFACTFTPR